MPAIDQISTIASTRLTRPCSEAGRTRRAGDVPGESARSGSRRTRITRLVRASRIAPAFFWRNGGMIFCIHRTRRDHPGPPSSSIRDSGGTLLAAANGGGYGNQQMMAAQGTADGADPATARVMAPAMAAAAAMAATGVVDSCRACSAGSAEPWPATGSTTSSRVGSHQARRWANPPRYDQGGTPGRPMSEQATITSHAGPTAGGDDGAAAVVTPAAVAATGAAAVVTRRRRWRRLGWNRRRWRRLGRRRWRW